MLLNHNTRGMYEEIQSQIHQPNAIISQQFKKEKKKTKKLAIVNH